MNGPACSICLLTACGQLVQNEKQNKKIPVYKNNNNLQPRKTMMTQYLFNELSSSSHNSLRLKKRVVSTLQVGKMSLRDVTSVAQILPKTKWQSQEFEPSSISLRNLFLSPACSFLLHPVQIFSSSSLPQGRMGQNPVAKSLVGASRPNSSLARPASQTG